ncbi:hypothetical protein [Mycobacterium sp. DL440]|uniref:hypothetical protein n=1 Tax=Mycobacterium sp. DL440 TaxID=2675523 RepID=UPI001421F9E1|nr:hypothetical protein [Mycobacterium sp. DL440]
MESVVVSRYELIVLGTSATDVVCSVGGRIADRAMSGWDVTVFLPNVSDDCPIRILGAKVLPLDKLATAASAQGPTAIAMAYELVSTDRRAQRYLTGRFVKPPKEVTLWGSLPSSAANDWVTARHVASMSGRAFKAHAMAAASTTTVSRSESEVLHSPASSSPGGRRACLRAIPATLIPNEPPVSRPLRST